MKEKAVKENLKVGDKIWYTERVGEIGGKKRGREGVISFLSVHQFGIRQKEGYVVCFTYNDLNNGDFKILQ